MISVIIINFRQKEFTINCVRSLYKQFRFTQFECIVINNSAEDDLSDLERDFKGLKLIYNSNKGFSQANNLGAKHATGKYLFFLNSDTVVRTDFTERLLQLFGSKEFGVVGLKLYNEDGTFQLSTGNEINFINEIKNKSEEKKFRERNIDFISSKEKELSDVTEAAWVTGAAMIIKKDNFMNCGGFDETFFLYYEDADICRRLTDAGFKNYFFPYSDIVHFKGENVNREFIHSNYFYSKQSQMIYYKKHNSLIENILLRSYLLMKFSLRYLLSFNKVYLNIIKLTLGIPVK